MSRLIVSEPNAPRDETSCLRRSTRRCGFRKAKSSAFTAFHIRLAGDRSACGRPPVGLAARPLTEDLRRDVDRLVEVARPVSPNKLHHLGLAAWSAVYPAAKLWGPGSTVKRFPGLAFARALEDEAPPEWGKDIDQAWVVEAPSGEAWRNLRRASRHTERLAALVSSPQACPRRMGQSPGLELRACRDRPRRLGEVGRPDISEARARLARAPTLAHPRSRSPKCRSPTRVGLEGRFVLHYDARLAIKCL